MERHDGYALRDLSFAGQPGKYISTGMRVIAIRATNIPGRGWFLEPYEDYPNGPGMLISDDELPEYFDKRSVYP